MVTGAASGIGLALAEAFAGRGLRVVLADVREDALQVAADGIAARGGDVLTVITDVANAAAVDTLARVTLERFGQVDVVCNNAGVIGPPGPAWEQDLEAWRWVLDVAFLGVVHGIRSFVPHFVRQGHGHVLNTASVGGLIPLPSHAPYNAAKHAVVGLTETLHAELRDVAPGVGATVLCPGMVSTSLSESSWANRPAALPGEPEQPPSIAEAMAGYAGMLAPADVATAAIAGIEAGRLHVIVGADSVPLIRARLDSVDADLPA